MFVNEIVSKWRKGNFWLLTTSYVSERRPSDKPDVYVTCFNCSNYTLFEVSFSIPQCFCENVENILLGSKKCQWNICKKQELVNNSNLSRKSNKFPLILELLNFLYQLFQFSHTKEVENTFGLLSNIKYKENKKCSLYTYSIDTRYCDYLAI